MVVVSIISLKKYYSQKELSQSQIETSQFLCLLVGQIGSKSIEAPVVAVEQNI